MAVVKLYYVICDGCGVPVNADLQPSHTEARLAAKANRFTSRATSTPGTRPTITDLCPNCTIDPLDKETP